MAPVHWRHLWTGANSGYYTFWWPAIRHDSFVVVTAAEGRTSDLVPDRFAAEERIEVGWERIWSIEPILFDPELVDMCDASVEDVAGASHRLPSGPLHDAAEVSRAGIPTVMMFVQSLRGLSHTKLEDTRPEHLELSVEALDRLTTRAIAWVAASDS